VSDHITEVRTALVQGFMDAVFVAPDHLAQENVKFVPPEGETWIKLTFVPVQPVVATLGSTGSDRVDGFLQADVNTPEGEGEAAAGALVDSIRDRFYAGSHWGSATIKSCGRSQGRNVNNFYRVSVSIMFYSQLKRS
jgi:hypothetical protein